jgi:hypothetical protein
MRKMQAQLGLLYPGVLDHLCFRGPQGVQGKERPRRLTATVPVQFAAGSEGDVSAANLTCRNSD